MRIRFHIIENYYLYGWFSPFFSLALSLSVPSAVYGQFVLVSRWSKFKHADYTPRNFIYYQVTRRFMYYRKSVLHLRKHVFHARLSKCSTDLRQYSVHPVFCYAQPGAFSKKCLYPAVPLNSFGRSSELILIRFINSRVLVQRVYANICLKFTRIKGTLSSTRSMHLNFVITCIISMIELSYFFRYVFCVTFFAIGVHSAT